MRIVVVGGGVIGLSTAFHLADRQAGEVILVEKGPVGDGSSSRAGGIITGLMGTETAVRTRKVSLEIFQRLSREVAGYTFHDVGTWRLIKAATDARCCLCTTASMFPMRYSNPKKYDAAGH